MARKAYKLKEEKEILSVPQCHRNNGIPLDIKEKVKTFYENDDVSRL